MTDHEITALAREYAEEYTKKKYPNAPGHVQERIIEGRMEHMEDFIPWLLRRYYLVEKEKAQQVKNCINTKAVDVVMNLLFPDLGKEVEE